LINKIFMDKEKDLLKQDLTKLGKIEEVEKFREDALLLGHEDIVNLANQKILEIQSKASSIEKTSESQVAQVGNMGGSTEEVSNRTAKVDIKIEEIKINMSSQIAKFSGQNQNTEKAE